MAVYEYTAKDIHGYTFKGTCDDIESIAGLQEELAKMGDTLIKAKRKKILKPKAARVKQSEIITFAYKFAGMCSAGISITQSLENIEEQTEDQGFRNVIADIKQNIEKGTSLKKAFDKHKNIFSEFFLGMIEAGETSGKLAETLENSAVFLESREDLKHKITSAFAYPILVGILCIIITTCLVVFVVPVFAKIYKQLHVSLPGPTLVLVGLSTIVRNFWWVILIIITALAFTLKMFSRNRYFKNKWDAFKLNMPILAKLNRMIVVSNFMRTFAMLLSAGVTLIRSLEVAATVANNSKISEITEDLQESIEAGNTVASSLREHDIFPSMITQLAASGEEAGALPDMLNKGVGFLDKDIDRTIKALLVRIEPALTVIIGLIIGLILMGVYLPMFDYMTHLK